ncbi:MAG: ferrous iron transport protein B [Planctomycetaceae bacterium]|jgi:ferrous iron transport protein B|nr:ferrous iron transport protein B [Planctomycetaceae bacterium]
MKHSHQDILVALAGQPNSGKSTIFQLLTGVHQQIANYAGVTVEKKSGHYHEQYSPNRCDRDHAHEENHDHFHQRSLSENSVRGNHAVSADSAREQNETHKENEARMTHEHASYNRRVELVDLPGIYSLTSYTQEERVSRDFLLLNSPEVVVIIVDASNLQRHLYFVFQILELQLPTVICLNMTDVAKRRGMTVNPQKLSEMLSVPVVPTNGAKGEGIEELRRAIHDSVQPVGHDFNHWKIPYEPAFEDAVTTVETALRTRPHLIEDFSARWLAVKLLENDVDARRIVQHHTHEENWEELLVLAEKTYKTFEAEHHSTPQKAIALARRSLADQIETACVQRDPNRRYHKSDAFDRIVCHPIFGYVFLVVIMFFSFQLTFQLADGWNWFPVYTQTEDNLKWGWEMGTPMGFCETVFSVWIPTMLEPALRLEEGTPVHSLVYDGIIGGVGGVIVFVPVIFFMFLVLSFLEQTGYIARVAMIMDRLMRVFGLQGQSIMPMILAGGISGGCAVPAIMTTRNMKDQRERILTILILPLMNCGAKMPVYLLLITAFFSAWRGLVGAALIFISWAISLLCAKFLSFTFVRGKSSPMLLELPAYQIPRLFNIVRTAGMQSWWFLKKAGTIILAVNILLWCLTHYPWAKEGISEAENLVCSDCGHVFLQAEEEEMPNAENLVCPDCGHVFFVSRTYRLAWAKTRMSDSGRLTNSYGGQVGRALEPVSRLAGFDWRDNIALVGGFVAKEVIVSSLGTLYHIDDATKSAEISEDAANPSENNIDENATQLAEKESAAPNAEEQNPDDDEEDRERLRLAAKLHDSPGWSGLKAFSMMLFVMVYAPCTASCSVIYQETRKIKWVAVAILFNTLIAFLLAVAVFQVGSLFG